MNSTPEQTTVPVSPGGETGIYVHVPFCNARCHYCDFYSGIAIPEELELYTKSIVNAAKNNEYTNRTIDTLYFGGGTPSLLLPKQLGRIINAVQQSYSLAGDTEITLEANPETVSAQQLAELVSLGFTRISFGVQSGINHELVALGRRHTAEAAQRSILLAEQAGFLHISGDLMLGIPYQTHESIQESLALLLALPLDHISAYMLGLEPTVPLYGSPLLAQCMPEDALTESYLMTIEQLEANGFLQYEISNFARAGGQSRHNTKYWTLQPYLGLGPSAHSYMDGKRFYFPPEYRPFVESSAPFALVVPDGTGGGIEEHLLLGLRLRCGITMSTTEKAYPSWDRQAFLQRATALEPSGLVQITGDTVALTPQGFLLSNGVIAELVL